MARNRYDVDEVLETPFDFAHLKRSFVYIKKYKGKMITALVLSVFAAISGLLGPLITQYALDNTIPQKNMGQLVLLTLAFVGTIAVSITFSTIRSRIMTVVGQDIIFDIRTDLFKHLQELPFEYYDNRPHGKILIRVVNYVNSVSDMLSNGIINVILECLNMIFMFFVNVKLSLVVLSGLPIFAVIMMMIKKRQRKAWQDVSNKSSNLNAYLQENITGARVTQIFTREEENAQIFDRLSEKYRKSWINAVKYSNLVWPATDNVSTLVRAAIFVVGLLVLTPAAVSLGTIVAMTSYASSFWQPIMNLSNIFNNFINNIAYLERIFETLDEPATIADKPNAQDIGDITGEVKFDDVTFSYEQGKTVLEHISFDVKPGESVALVGPTGAGKSTVVSLLSRFYDLDSGKITIDGKDISQATLHSLRSQMGIMLQDSFIFSGTIYDNIRYGRLDATEEEIREAAKIVCADEFISEMKDGYMTEVNERGSKLSGGQKQRVAIAGIIAMKPDCILLDEPTAMLDPHGRDEVMKTVKMLNEQGVTIVLITHYMEEAAQAQRVVVIDGGEVIMDNVPKKIFSNVETMKNLGLDVPQVTELCWELKRAGYDISTEIIHEDECVQKLYEMLK